MRKKAYTLLEILAVIVIGGIMVSAAVPAFSRIMQGSSTGLAARELMGKLNAARTYAVANRTHVAIVFPRKSEGAPSNYSYTAYRVCEVFQNGAALEFKRWIPGESWTFLPSGTVIGFRVGGTTVFTTFTAADEIVFPQSSASFEQEASADPASSQTLTFTSAQLDIPGFTSGSNLNLGNMIVFRPDGTLKSMRSTVIPISEARWVDSTHLLGLKAGYIPLVIRMTGKMRVYNELKETWPSTTP